MKSRSVVMIAVAAVICFCASVCQPVYAEGSAPLAENLELMTYRNVSVGGKLSAYDPEGDVLSFQISTEPVKGSIVLEQDGSFVYTPNENRRGRDYFGYRAIDSEGNISQEATVIIRIMRRKKEIQYTDMMGRADEYAAVALCENDIFTGEQICGSYCFYPDKTVSRGEFISMCLAVTKEPVMQGVISTGYADDSSIPVWMKAYITTASMCGIRSDRVTEDGCIFDADSAISKAEAVAMLDKAMNITKISYLDLDEALDAELAQACANLSACGIINEGTRVEETLKRSEAAEMLAAALNVIEKR